MRLEFEQDAPEIYAGQILTRAATLSWGTQKRL